MSVQYVKLCSVILKQIFGEIVQKIGESLLGAPSRTLKSVIKSTNLSRSDVCAGLSILIKFGIVEFSKSQVNETEVEYSIKKERVLFILKYSKYVYHIQTKYGAVAASIIEELLRVGSETATTLLSKCFINADNKDSLVNYRDMFINLINERYIVRQPAPVTIADENNPIPILKLEDDLYFKPPEINLSLLQEILTSQGPKPTPGELYWTVNFLQFHQDFRDLLMISAIENKLGIGAGECLKFVLKLIYTKTFAWEKECSNPFSLAEVKQFIDKKKVSSDLIKYVDNYVVLIAEDSLGFLQKVGEVGGGQYVVNFKKGLQELAFICVENVINEKFGSKAARIFRVIKSKQYIEQEEIQKEAMIPSKEAKLLTYNLFQEHFIQIKTIRKAGGGGTGPAKSFFLFHTSLTPVVHMLLDHCHKSLCNIITRSVYEKSENKRLIDKSQKLDSIVETIKERGESEEYIAEILETLTPAEREILQNVKNHIKTLSTAELILENTIFLLQLYQYHNSNKK
ncbi:DNA-directed RNA polymerase III subunit RPC3 [Condylostylus longicornis]|uniref:DNA-directed RNA polymerase III subunit RPC3 n=1 Tax=Condylostylus longicornis TaxID=2530218 RepID=UPI00244DAD98|nr:DNA-directed RNA polymerase III subunit RPC3 [Condylostylus longicornis]